MQHAYWLSVIAFQCVVSDGLVFVGTETNASIQRVALRYEVIRISGTILREESPVLLEQVDSKIVSRPRRLNESSNSQREVYLFPRFFVRVLLSPL